MVYEARMRNKQKSLQRVEQENKKLLQRLQDVHSSYDSVKWADQRSKIEKEIQFKCKYPSIFTLQKSDDQQSKLSLAQSLRQSHLGVVKRNDSKMFNTVNSPFTP